MSEEVKSLAEHAEDRELKPVRKAIKKFNKGIKESAGHRPVKLSARKGGLPQGECHVDVRVFGRTQPFEITGFKFELIHDIVKAVEFGIQEMVVNGAMDAGEFWINDTKKGKVLHVNAIDQERTFDLNGAAGAKMFVEVAAFVMDALNVPAETKKAA